MVGDIHISDFDYSLPDNRIALHPLSQRDHCKLLVCNAKGNIRDDSFTSLPSLLPSGSILVCNNTRVINARMQFRKPTGSLIEIFLLEPLAPTDYALMFQHKSPVTWKCLIGNLKRWKSGTLSQQLDVNGTEVTLTAERLSNEPFADNSHSVRLSWDNTSFSAADIISAAGNIPIPPYLNRESEECDNVDYQTIYSKIKGSVAAPTAGLHFTPHTIAQLSNNGIKQIELTLHVGAGTFRPVKSETIGEHPMHTEVFSVSITLIETIIKAIKEKTPITAVGTTSVRTLESLPYLGRHIIQNSDLSVEQWEAYTDPIVDPIESLEALATHMRKHSLQQLTASTAIMIAPGFKWNIVSNMVTNFHQPQSTLLLLVSSFLGNDEENKPRWQKVYQHALDGEYRFLSYGDACLFTHNNV